MNIMANATSKYLSTQIEEAIASYLNYDPDQTNGWIGLESTEENPIDLDIVVNLGNYTMDYAITSNPAESTAPAPTIKSSPINVSVVNVDGKLIQIIMDENDIYIREFLTINPYTFSDWKKLDESTKIDISATEPTDAKDGDWWIDTSVTPKPILKVKIDGKYTNVTFSDKMDESIYDPDGTHKDVGEYIEDKLKEYPDLVTDTSALTEHINDDTIHLNPNIIANLDKKENSSDFYSKIANAEDEQKKYLDDSLILMGDAFDDISSKAPVVSKNIHDHIDNPDIHVGWKSYTVFTSKDIMKLCSDNNTIVAILAYDMDAAPTAEEDTNRARGVIYSNDGGLTWMNSFVIPWNDSTIDIIFGNKTFILYCKGKTDYYISADGIRWIKQDFAKGVNSIVFGGGRFFAIGDEGYAITSLDGIKWNAANLALNETLNYDRLFYCNNQFIFQSEDSDNNVLQYTSADLINFISGEVTDKFSQIIYNPFDKKYYAVVAGEDTNPLYVTATDPLFADSTKVAVTSPDNDIGALHSILVSADESMYFVYTRGIKKITSISADNLPIPTRNSDAGIIVGPASEYENYNDFYENIHGILFGTTLWLFGNSIIAKYEKTTNNDTVIYNWNIRIRECEFSIKADVFAESYVQGSVITRSPYSKAKLFHTYDGFSYDEIDIGLPETATILNLVYAPSIRNGMIFVLVKFIENDTEVIKIGTGLNFSEITYSDLPTGATSNVKMKYISSKSKVILYCTEETTGHIFETTNGNTWTTIVNTKLPGPIEDIIYVNNFIITAHNIPRSCIVRYSTTTTTVTTNNIDDHINKILYVNGICYYFGSSKSFFSKNNLDVFEEIPSLTGINVHDFDVADSRVVITGTNLKTGNSVLAISTPTINWNIMIPVLRDTVAKIKFSGVYFVAIGYLSTYRFIFDKRDWHTRAEGNHSHIRDGRVKVDPKHIVGNLTPSQIPDSEKVEIHKVATLLDMLSLKAEEDGIKVKDKIYIESTNTLYTVKDIDKLDSMDGYNIDSIGVSGNILWENIKHKPTTLRGYKLEDDAYTKTEISSIVNNPDINFEARNAEVLINLNDIPVEEGSETKVSTFNYTDESKKATDEMISLFNRRILPFIPSMVDAKLYMGYTIFEKNGVRFTTQSSPKNTYGNFGTYKVDFVSVSSANKESTAEDSSNSCVHEMNILETKFKKFILHTFTAATGTILEDTTIGLTDFYSSNPHVEDFDPNGADVIKLTLPYSIKHGGQDRVDGSLKHFVRLLYEKDDVKIYGLLQFGYTDPSFGDTPNALAKNPHIPYFIIVNGDIVEPNIIAPSKLLTVDDGCTGICEYGGYIYFVTVAASATNNGNHTSKIYRIPIVETDPYLDLENIELVKTIPGTVISGFYNDKENNRLVLCETTFTNIEAAGTPPAMATLLRYTVNNFASMPILYDFNTHGGEIYHIVKYRDSYLFAGAQHSIYVAKDLTGPLYKVTRDQSFYTKVLGAMPFVNIDILNDENGTLAFHANAGSTNNPRNYNIVTTPITNIDYELIGLRDIIAKL